MFCGTGTTLKLPSSKPTLIQACGRVSELEPDPDNITKPTKQERKTTTLQRK